MYQLVCKRAPAYVRSCGVQALGPWEYSGSFSRPHIAMNGAGWQRDQQPTHLVRGWHWDDYAGIAQWTDSYDVTWAGASGSSCQCFRLKCISRVSDLVSRLLIGKKKLILLISNHNSSWCEVMFFFFFLNLNSEDSAAALPQWSDSLLSTQEGNTL